MSHQLETLAAKLAARTPSARGRISACFQECFALLEEKLEAKISVKDALEDFNSAYNLNVGIGSFRKLLQEHRQRRRTHGASNTEDAEAP